MLSETTIRELSSAHRASLPLPDFLTILVCGADKRAAKRYTSLASPPEDYDAGGVFGHITQGLSNFSALVDVLGQLRRHPGAFVVRGRVKEGQPTQILRRAVDREGEPATIEACAHHWVALDADETTTPFDPRDPRGSVERWRTTLPPGLRDAAVVFHFSAKQHQKPMVRGRAWFWSEQPVTDGEGDVWSRQHGLDPCVFRTVQPIYTADPVFAGCADPLDRSLVQLPGGFARLELTAEQRAQANAPKPVVVLDDREPGEDNGLFYELLSARGYVRRQLSPGKWIVTCPREQEHSAPGGEGTVLWAPSAGQTLGVIHCSHSNGGHDRFKAPDWLACFSAEERAAAAPERELLEAMAAHAVVVQPYVPPTPAALPPASSFPAAMAPPPQTHVLQGVPTGAMTPPPLAAGADLPTVIGDARGSQFWIRRNADYFSPVAKGMLPARLKQAIPSSAKMKADDIAAGAVIAEVVIRDFAATGICWNSGESAIIQGYSPPHIPQLYDAAVDAWLRVLAGERFELVAQWFATCVQSRISSLAACLVLIGGTGIGKTLIAIVASRMWGVTSPVPLAHAIDKFNSTITDCPIVLDDEAARMRQGDVATNDFREMLSRRERAFEPKGVDKRKLRGCQRFVIACNAFSDLRFSDVGSAEVVEALADRLLVVRCGPAHDVRHALQPLRMPGSDDVDLTRLDRHIAWLVANTPVTPARFLASPGRDDPAARQAVLDGVLQRYPELFDLVAQAVARGEHTDLVDPPAAFVREGRLWVRGDRAGAMLTARESLSARDVFRALAPWESTPRRDSLWLGGRSIRARAYDLARLAAEVSLPAAA